MAIGEGVEPHLSEVPGSVDLPAARLDRVLRLLSL